MNSEKENTVVYKVQHLPLSPVLKYLKMVLKYT